MSVRRAKNKLTGRTDGQPEVVLGYRDGGIPGITVHMPFDYSHAGFADRATLRQFIADLQVGLAHLNGGDTASR